MRKRHEESVRVMFKCLCNTPFEFLEEKNQYLHTVYHSPFTVPLRTKIFLQHWLQLWSKVQLHFIMAGILNIYFILAKNV